MNDCDHDVCMFRLTAFTLFLVSGLSDSKCIVQRFFLICIITCLYLYSGGLDFSGPVERFFYDPITRKSLVQSVVSLTGFALVGGPASQDHPKAIEALSKLNVPYLVALPLVFQTTEEWLGSSLGLHPIQVALQVALPELDGGLEPIVFSGRDSRTGTKMIYIFFY